MQNNLKVGDKVQILSLDRTRDCHGVNHEMEKWYDECTPLIIEHTTESGEYLLAKPEVPLSPLSPSHYFCEEDLGLVTPLIEVGDTVELVNISNSFTAGFDIITSDVVIGETYEVSHVDDNLLMFVDCSGEIHLEDVNLIAKGSSVAEEEVEDDDVEYTITSDSITLVYGSETSQISSDHPSFYEIRRHIIDSEFLEAHTAMNVSNAIESWAEGGLTIEFGEVVYEGLTLTGKLVDRIIDCMAAGDLEFERLARFLVLLRDQPSFKTRERLMDFAANKQLDLTMGGCIVAFKNVDDEFMDKHSRTFRNRVGDVVEMPREDVDDDHSNACSNGLHVCSPEYLRGFWGTSGQTMRVVVEPKDFVAIPYDYNDSKARVCKYTVVENVTDKVEEYL